MYVCAGSWKVITPLYFSLPDYKDSPRQTRRWASCVWLVVWEAHAQWSAPNEKNVPFFLKTNIWSAAPSLPGLNQNKSVKGIIFSKNSQSRISNNIQTSQVIVSLPILFVFFILPKTVFSLLLWSLDCFCLVANSCMLFLIFLFLINNIIPSW